jgi:hypothetical protein
MSAPHCNLDVKHVQGRERVGREIVVGVRGGLPSRFGGRSDLIMFDQTDPPKLASVNIVRPAARVVV